MSGPALPQVSFLSRPAALESSVLCGKRRECWLWDTRVNQAVPSSEDPGSAGPGDRWGNHGSLAGSGDPGRLKTEQVEKGSEVLVPHLRAARMD